ncbi:MAG: OadG family protein [Clostridiales bacterium]|nr:OadG family protein [Clostridiales bacterium]
MHIETIELGVNTTIIGMGVVFSVLVILTFTTWLLTTLVDGRIERKKAIEVGAMPATAEPVPASATPMTPTLAPSTASISAKTVAAIIAAVSLASGKPLKELHFIAIRRDRTAATVWSASSTADIIANRQAYL